MFDAALGALVGAVVASVVADVRRRTRETRLVAELEASRRQLADAMTGAGRPRSGSVSPGSYTRPGVEFQSGLIGDLPEVAAD